MIGIQCSEDCYFKLAAFVVQALTWVLTIRWKTYPKCMVNWASTTTDGRVMVCPTASACSDRPTVSSKRCAIETPVLIAATLTRCTTGPSTSAPPFGTPYGMISSVYWMLLGVVTITGISIALGLVICPEGATVRNKRRE